jgi:hypothetical protein
MESTKNTKQVSAVQIKYMLVPECTFHDRRCHDSGITERKKPIPENIVNVVLEAVISACSVFFENSKLWCTSRGLGQSIAWGIPKSQKEFSFI